MTLNSYLRQTSVVKHHIYWPIEKTCYSFVHTEQIFPEISGDRWNWENVSMKRRRISKTELEISDLCWTEEELQLLLSCKFQKADLSQNIFKLFQIVKEQIQQYFMLLISVSSA